jgi:hypothetical protein
MRTKRRVCDRCGRIINKKTVRYIAKIQVYAAYDPLQIRSDDLLRDHTAEIEKLVRQCEDLTEEELMRGVYVDFEFDLCSSCQRVYVKNPIGKRKRP